MIHGGKLSTPGMQSAVRTSYIFKTYGIGILRQLSQQRGTTHPKLAELFLRVTIGLLASLKISVQQSFAGGLASVLNAPVCCPVSGHWLVRQLAT